MIKIHIGLALLAMKEMCTNCGSCSNCPMEDFCRENEDILPCVWDAKTFPDTIAILDTKKEK